MTARAPATALITMLRLLSIRNFVVVEALEVEFERGFTVLTGETGAGKSILLDALSLLLGGRFEARQLRPGSERAEIAAEFEVADSPPLRAWLVEQEFDARGTACCCAGRSMRRAGVARGSTAVRRRSRSSRTPARSWSTCTASTPMSRWAGRKRSAQLVDAFGGFAALAREIAAAWRRWREAD